MKRFAALAFTAAALALTACNDGGKKADASASAAPAKSAAMCVSCAKPAGDKPVMVSYKGKSLPMCCESCAKQFNAMTDKEKDAKVAANAKG